MENIINPNEIYDRLFTIQFVYDHYLVVSDNAQNAIEEFGTWARKNAPGYISEIEEANQLREEEGEAWFEANMIAINGREFYLNELPQWINESEYDLPTRLEHSISGSMRPCIVGPAKVYEIESDKGTDYCLLEYGYDPNDYIKKDGDWMEVTLHEDVYLACLDMPGYMDMTDYSMHETWDDAAQHLIDTYGDE